MNVCWLLAYSNYNEQIKENLKHHLTAAGLSKIFTSDPVGGRLNHRVFGCWEWQLDFPGLRFCFGKTKDRATMKGKLVNLSLTSFNRYMFYILKKKKTGLRCVVCKWSSRVKHKQPKNWCVKNKTRLKL